ncbi:MAG: hypothetical protein K0Q95_804 [Bacteroidota bacterium]|jgi:hypothetical protein|nr:hypothetical protein [Bacteroidota bacterium]
MMKRSVRFFTAILIITAVNFCYSQNTKFARSYGGSGYDYGYSVKQTFDNGFIVCGSTTSFGAGATDLYLIKLDSAGNPAWHKTFGGVNIDKGYSVVQTSDSCYVIAGYTNSLGFGGYDVFVIKTNSLGDTLWTKTYGGTDWDFGYSIQSTSDTGFIIAGGTYSFGTGSEDMYLVKIDGEGAVQWSKTYGGTNEDEAKSVKQTNDGGYILTGFTKSFGDINKDIYVVRTTPLGDTVWTKQLGGSLTDEGADIIEAANGDFVLVGGTRSSGVGGYDCVIMRLGILGDSLWSRTYGTLNYNFATSLLETNSNKFVFSNTTEDSGAGLKDGCIFIADAAGYFVNTLTYGSAYNEEVYSISKCSDNGYVICGYTEGYNSGLSNVYVVKTDSLGNSIPFVISVNELEHSNQFQIFPNPTLGGSVVSISLENRKLNVTYRIKILDVTGKFVRELECSADGSTISFPIGQLENGTYLINLIEDNTIVGYSKLTYIN